MKGKGQNKIAKEWLDSATRPYKGVVAFLTALSVVVTLLSLGFAYLVRYLINFASQGESKLLWIFAGVLLGILLLKVAFKTFEGYLAERTRARMYVRLRKDTFSKILRADYSRLQGYHSGELLNRMSADVQEICVDSVGLMPVICGMLVQCLGAVAALLTIDPLFTLIYVVCGCILGGMTALFRRQIKRRQKEVLEADGRVRSFAQEGLSSVMTVKAYCAEGKTVEKFDGLSKKHYDKRMKRTVLHAQMNAIFTLLSNFGLIFAVVWCSISVLNGNKDYGSILSVILLLMQLQQPLTSFSSIIPVFYARSTSAERLAELSNLPTEQEEKKEALCYDDLQGIRLEGVDFSYGRDSVLQGASARINKGEIVCLTGPSGAGKSTIFKLLLNVFQPQAGTLLLEGEKTQPLAAAHRKLFAYVPQGNFLFSGTIYENLTFFLEEERAPVSLEEVKNALDTACAEFVYDLPQGLETKLREGGEGLSEGQLQRLNVARAILSNRPILLLDEATSALDGETEERLLENIRKLRNKTCLIVTHRPAALSMADRILRVENGSVVEIRD